MSTPASLLDIIARGGSMVGANEAAQSQAQTALTNAQVPRVQAETAQTEQATQTQAQLTRQAQLQNQQRELALRDNAIIRDAMTKVEPVPNEDPAAYLGRITENARRSGISAGGYIDLTQNLAKALETKSKLQGEALTQHGQIVEQAGNLLQALKTAPPDQVDAVYAREQPALDKLEPGVFPPALPTDPAQRQSLIDQWAASHHVSAALLGQEETKAKIANLESESKKNAAAASLSTAQTPGAEAESTIKQGEAAAMKSMTPENIAEMVKGSIDPQKYPDQYNRTLNDASNALRLGLGTRGVQAAIKDGADRIGQRENAIAQAQVTSIPFREAALQNQQFQRTQQSYQFHAAELDKLAAPVAQTQERIQRLNDTIAQGTPQADALVAPELLSVMAGGQGSGLRMNEAEISRIVGGRSKWESLKAAINQWSLDPSKANSITPAQREQIHNLVATVTEHANQRQAIIMQARSAIAGASGPEQHRAILADTMGKLGQTTASGQNSGAASVPEAVKSVLSSAGAGIYTLSDGTRWMKAADGTITKQ